MEKFKENQTIKWFDFGYVSTPPKKQSDLPIIIWDFAPAVQ